MDKIQQRICDIIDQHQEELIAFARDIWYHAELGFKETRTAGKFVSALKKLGMEVEEGLAVTGSKGYLNGKGASGLTIGLQGEYDALPIPTHVDANPETGAAHCCGHNAQLTGVLGAAFALSDPEVKAAMAGNIVFMGIPAEEYVEVEFKKSLMEKGLIRYGGGKCEMLRIGAWDDIDITVGHHACSGQKILANNVASNGTVSKIVTFTGRSSHAAGGPHHGVDALAAANIAMHAVDAQRETFRDKDTVRVHGFISNGGEATNIIAERTRLEYSVRANNISALKNASEKVDRAMAAGAVATGCGVNCETLPGYLPVIPVKDMRSVEEALSFFTDKYELDHRTEQGTASTDSGDVSSICPLVRFSTGGYEGQFHSPNVRVVDEYLAYIVTAKMFALVTYNLLKNGGEYAKAVLDSYQALMTKEEYIAYMESMKKTMVIDRNFLPVLE